MQLEQLQALYKLPFFELISKAHQVHREHWQDNVIQLCTLLSIKTGGCSEDCAYCSQSARYKSNVQREELMSVEAVLVRAKLAKQNGSTRFCMGAAWKGVKAGTKKFEQVIAIVKAVAALEMEVCVTLGEIGSEEAQLLKQAGVTAYNHNIDTSPEHYPKIVTSHSFEDRLKTIRHAQDAGMSVCCGGILGLGESTEDRLKMLSILSEFNPHPESIPINMLMPMPGTPLADADPVSLFDLVRMIALTRIAVPRAKVRLSAGRSLLSEEGQTLCFYAGANSIFYGEKLLTASNPSVQKDQALIAKLGMTAQAPDIDLASPCANEDKKLSPCCEEVTACCEEVSSRTEKISPCC